MIKKYGFILKYVSTFLCGVILGFLIHKNPVYQFKNIRENSDEYQFINPLLFIKVLDQDVSSEYLSLKENIEEYVDEQIDTKKATDVSVYFRNLNSSQ